MQSASGTGVALAKVPKPNAPNSGEKRLNLILSSTVFDDVNALAKERRTTMTEIVRLAIGLVKVAIHEAKRGNKLVVANSEGQVLKELILPG